MYEWLRLSVRKLSSPGSTLCSKGKCLGRWWELSDFGSLTFEAQKGGAAMSQQGRGQKKRGSQWRRGEGTKTQVPRCGARLEAAISYSKGDTLVRLSRGAREGAGTSGWFHNPRHGDWARTVMTPLTSLPHPRLPCGFNEHGGSYQRHEDEKNVGHITAAESAVLLLENLVYSWTSVTL